MVKIVWWNEINNLQTERKIRFEDLKINFINLKLLTYKENIGILGSSPGNLCPRPRGLLGQEEGLLRQLSQYYDSLKKCPEKRYSYSIGIGIVRPLMNAPIDDMKN